MKRSHLFLSLAALTLAFALPAIASATNTATGAKSASAPAAKSMTAAKSTSASKSIMPHRHSKASQASASKSHKIDLNTASREELMTLQGVDGPLADKIIEGRPYKNMNQLVGKNIVSKSEYSKIKSHVTARQSAMHSEAK